MKPTGPLSTLAAVAVAAVILAGFTAPALGQYSDGSSSTTAQPTEFESGLTLRVYDIGRPMSRLAPLRPDQTPNADLILEKLNLPNAESFGGPGVYFIAHASGVLVIEEAGEHIFELSSDDGARLLIDAGLVIDHDGLHAAIGKEGRVRLDAGLHPFRVEMFQNEGEAALTLRWKTPGADAFETVPPSAFRVEKGLTRVVSPGRKVVLDGNEHLRPGSGMAVPGVHPMWTVETVRPEGVEHRIGGMDFLPDGSLVYSEFLPKNNGVLRTETNGSIWRLASVSGGSERAPAVPVEIADGFHDPSGVVCVGTDIYVSHRPGIELLRDTDGNGTYETRETFATPWVGSNYHHFSFGLQHHTDNSGDWIYGTLSTSIYFDTTLEGDPVEGEIIGMNGPNPPHRGSCYRINLETKEVEWLAGGLRTPNGILVDSDGDVFVADNQGAWQPANRLNHIRAGRFYGHYNGLQKSRLFPEGGTPADFMAGGEWPPAVWLPQNEVSNSPTTPVEIPDGPFQGQYWLGELTAGGIRRVFLEKVNGEFQGAVFRHTQGLESGVNRLVYGPDGCLYMGGTGADGNWNWRGTQFGLQRLRPTGKTAFEYQNIQATQDGLVVSFTEPVSPAWTGNPANYTITQWYYFATPEYGGVRHNEQRLAVDLAIPSRGGRAVRLIIPGLRAGSVVHIRCDPESTSGASMWSTEAWYTLNQIPGQQERFRGPAGELGVDPIVNALRNKSVLVFSKTAGFRHDSIPTGIECFKDLATEHGFAMDVTEDAAEFNATNLKNYDAVVFLNTTGDVLDDAQQGAFEVWYRAGGGYLGIHSAADTEYDWPWYGELVGTSFKRHPRIQPARMVIATTDHPATAHLGGFPYFNTWTRTDEWYDFRAQPAEGVLTLLTLDPSTYTGGSIGDNASVTRTHPIAWCRAFDGGRTLYTGGGHRKEAYIEPDFRRHLLGALAWVMGEDD